MKNTIIGAVVVLLCLSLASCHHKAEDNDLGYLDGSPEFFVDAYVRPGTRIETDVTGVSHPEGLGLGIFWVETIDNQIDTVRRPEDPPSTPTAFSFTVKDTIGTFYLRCTAYADGYYVSNSSAVFSVVKTGLDQSLTGRGIAKTDPHVADKRDASVPAGENFYYYTTIAGLDWMRNNLCYTGSGVPYRECEVMNAVSGRFYTWEEAVKACPEGWRLPTDAEWTAMVSAVTGTSYSAGAMLPGAAGALMADAYFNGNKLWEFWPEVKIANTSRLAVTPFGYATVDGENHSYVGMGNYAVFWLADSATNTDTQALYRYFYVKQPDIYIGQADKSHFGASVRCVREAQ